MLANTHIRKTIMQPLLSFIKIIILKDEKKKEIKDSILRTLTIILQRHKKKVRVMYDKNDEDQGNLSSGLFF